MAASTPRLQQQGQFLTTVRRGSSDKSAVKNWTFQTLAPHVHKILYWRILCMPLLYVTHGSGTFCRTVRITRTWEQKRGLLTRRWGRRSTAVLGTSSGRRRMSELSEFLFDRTTKKKKKMRKSFSGRRNKKINSGRGSVWTWSTSREERQASN